MPKAALILPSYYEAIKDLPDTDRLAIYDCLVRYGLYGEEIVLPAHLKGYFILMRPSIDASRNKYDAACANGSMGGAPKGNQNRRKKQQENNQTNNQRINQDEDEDKEKDLEKANDVDKAKEYTNPSFLSNGEDDPGAELRKRVDESMERIRKRVAAGN